MMLKRFFLPLLSLIFISVIFEGCKKQDDYQQISSVKKSAFKDSNMNRDFDNLAKVISVAMQDEEDFRHLLKKEVLKKFDGDYDVLFSKLTGCSYKDETQTVKTLLVNKVQKLVSCSSLNIVSSSKSAEDFITSMIEAYPNLQISVPVHAEDWNENYIPTVAFVPEEVDEQTTEHLIGYRADSTVFVDAKKVPNKPVVIVSKSERVLADGTILPYYPPQDVYIDLEGNTTDYGIFLRWRVSNASTRSLMGYHIYRKSIGAANFSLVATCDGYGNTVYCDNQINVNQTYYYMVKAYNHAGDGSSSNIISVTAPSYPLPLIAFDATNLRSNEVELRWNRVPDQYVTSTKLYKRVVGQGDYQYQRSFDNNIFDYVDNNVTPGQQVIYKMTENNSVGESEPKYDFVVIPYRDISVYSPVYIVAINFNRDYLSDMESWFLGAPEFVFTIVKTSSDGEPIIVNPFVMCMYERRKGYCEFTNIKISDWLPENWMEMYTFSAHEWDGDGGKMDLTISANYQIKNSDKTGLTTGGSVGITLKDIQTTSAYNLGQAVLPYINPKKSIIPFSHSSGFRAVISEQNHY